MQVAPNWSLRDSIYHNTNLWLNSTHSNKLLIRSVRYDLNQLNTVPETPPKTVSKRAIKRERYTVSKSLLIANLLFIYKFKWFAFSLRSRRIRIERQTESEAISRPFVTLTNAVSTLLNVWKPDCKGSNRLFSVKWEINGVATTRSKILARKGRLEMRFKLLRFLWSVFVFLGIGVTTVILKATGTTPVHKEGVYNTQDNRT